MIIGGGVARSSELIGSFKIYNNRGLRCTCSCFAGDTNFQPKGKQKEMENILALRLCGYGRGWRWKVTPHEACPKSKARAGGNLAVIYQSKKISEISKEHLVRRLRTRASESSY